MFARSRKCSRGAANVREEPQMFARSRKCSRGAALVGTGWGRGTQQAQSESNPVLLPYHHAPTSGELSAFISAHVGEAPTSFSILFSTRLGISIDQYVYLS
jgi:hypothetical protein